MIYLDSNVFIYFVEGRPEWAEPLKALFDSLLLHPGAAITSELTLAEVLAPAKLGGARPPHIKRLYLDTIVWNRAISSRPVSRNIFYETAELRKITGRKLPDAIHIVTAINAKCRYFVSRDRDARKLRQGMDLAVPDQNGVNQMIEFLRAQ